jgi:hypothetical protein
MLVASEEAPLSSTILKFRPLFEIFFVLVTNVVAANIKTRDLSRNMVDHAFERIGPEVSAVTKDASLRMVAGLDQFQGFARRKHLASAMSKSPQGSARDQSGARIRSNQFLKRANPVTGDRREDLFRDRKDLSASFAGKAEIKNPNCLSNATAQQKQSASLLARALNENKLSMNPELSSLEAARDDS